jgi:hypothetical protein
MPALGRRKRRRLPAKAGRVSLVPVRARRRAAGRGVRGVKRPSWKIVGLAGIAGVAATGVVVARSRRTHSELAPDELRERLHSRLAEVGRDPGAPPPPAPPGAAATP